MKTYTNEERKDHMERIGEEISERLHIEPPRIFVERIIRPKYALRECEGTEDEDKPVVRITYPRPSFDYTRQHGYPRIVKYDTDS